MSDSPAAERAERSPLAIYQAHLAEGRLAYQWSVAAERAVFYPRLVCPFSGSTELEWRIAAGGGTVHAATIVHPRGGEPYSIVLVDVDEGFRLMSRVVDCAPEAVRIGQRVALAIRPLEPDGEPLPLFRRQNAA